MATKKEQIEDSVISSASESLGKMMVPLFAGAIGLFFVVMNWENISNISRSADNISKNTDFRESQQEWAREIDVKIDRILEISDRNNMARIDQEEINRERLVRLTQLEAIQSNSADVEEDLQEIGSTVDRFSNRFSDVEEDARGAEELATSVRDQFQAYSVASDRQTIELEKEVANLKSSAEQAKVERDRNTEFSSAQPQRAATRIEQIATLRRDTNSLDTELHVFIDQTDANFEHQQRLREEVIGRLAFLEAQTSRIDRLEGRHEEAPGTHVQ